MAGGLLGAAVILGLAWIGHLAATSWIELIHVVLELDSKRNAKSGRSSIY